MQSFLFPYRSSLVHYLKAGSGKQLLFCFHGYGENGGSFSFLEPSLGSRYTIICMDLPHHGKTDWQEGTRFEPEELLLIMKGIASEHQLILSGLTIAGFSMGGRVALSLLRLMPGQIEKLLLIAPDGLKMNFWYWLATQNRAGNRFFGFTMKHPRWFLNPLRAGNRLGLVNRSIYKFSMVHLENEQVRKELYTRWTTMRNFGCPQSVLKRLIKENNISVELVYGKHDRMIRTDTGMKFKKELAALCGITVLPEGHQLLHPKNLDLLVSLL